MAMSQPKGQAPFFPGQKEPVDLVDEQESSGSGRSTGDGESKGGERRRGGEEKQQQQGDYYAPVATEVTVKKESNSTSTEPDQSDENREGAEMNRLYSPEAGVDIATSNKQSVPRKSTKEMAMAVAGADSEPGGTDEHEQRGEASGTVVSGPGLVEAGKGMATEVGESLASVRTRVMEKLSKLHLPSESLEAVRRTFETGIKGAYTTTRDAAHRTRQSLLELFPSSLTSSTATEARKVVEEMEKDMLANSEGSGRDMSDVAGGPKVSETSDPPQFMRAKL